MQKLFELFDEIGLPYHRQGSLANQDYPPSFFTFFNIDTPPESYYDNKLTRYNEYVQIGFYTNDASKIYSQLDIGGEFYKKIKEKSKDFVLAALPKDADADDDNYFGRVCYIRIIHNI
jgi:hypothetical protein